MSGTFERTFTDDNPAIDNSGTDGKNLAIATFPNFVSEDTSIKLNYTFDLLNTGMG
jgi:hypothetical protein